MAISMSFQKPFMGELEPGEAWTVSGLLLPGPPPPPSFPNPELGTDPGYPTVAPGFLSHPTEHFPEAAATLGQG